MVIVDPFISTYFKSSSSIYTGYEKTKAFFSTKEESLQYIKELEDENSRLHNKLSYYEHTDCGQTLTTQVSKVETETPILNTSTSTQGSSTVTSLIGKATTTTQKKETEIVVDPCVLVNSVPFEKIPMVRASPLLSSLSYLFDTVRLNKGFQSGVEEGAIVYTRGMVAVGKVLSVSNSSSLVLLYSKDTVETYGSLQKDSSSFKVIGNGGGTYIALVSRDTEVNVGETVLLTENQDFALGIVKEVSFLKQDVSKKILIEGGFNPAQLSVFYISTHE